MIQQRSTAELQALAKSLRRDIVTMIHASQSGHPGGSLSAIDLITALYFGGVLVHDPKNTDWPERDRFILSKGHGVPALYAALAADGTIEHDRLKTLRKTGSALQGHPVYGSLPGIEASTGSLGQGLSVGIGMALAAHLDEKSYHVFVLCGDGEIQEGQVWEAAMYAGAKKMRGITLILDDNRYQLDGAVAEILPNSHYRDKFEAFGWFVEEIDGHDVQAAQEALLRARGRDRATAIIAHTVKGKGVSFMENNNEFHGVAPNDDQLAKALKELA